METENKKKRPSSYEDFMNAHEYIFNEKRLNWRNSITNNLLHQKNISKYEKLKKNVVKYRKTVLKSVGTKTFAECAEKAIELAKNIKKRVEFV